MKRSVTALVVGLVVATSAFGKESLADKKYWSGQMDYMKSSLDSASEKCGVKFTFDWIDREDLKTKTEAQQGSPNGICSNIVDEVRSLCASGDDELKAVKENIAGFKCGWAKDNKRSLELKNKTLTYRASNEANFSDWAKPWLMKSM